MLNKFQCIYIVFVLLFGISYSSYAQGVTSIQIANLIPDTQDLPGFTRNIPLREQASECTPSGDINGHYVEHMPAPTYCHDYIRLNQDATKWAVTWVPLKTQPGSYSTIARTFYSIDDKYRIGFAVYICDSPDTAASELLAQIHASQAVYTPGTPVGTTTLGDESWTCSCGGVTALRYRAGCMIVQVNGGPSGTSMKAGENFDFPPAAVEAVGEEILMRACCADRLTGISSRQARIAVNGKSLAETALVSGRTAYVPALAFARALGYQGRWNAKTGVLTFTGTGHPAVTLTADSTAARVGAKSVTLPSPLLSERGQPVGTLASLAALLGGNVTHGKGRYRITSERLPA